MSPMVELRTLEKEDRSISLEVQGEDDTILNLIRQRLLEDDNVSAATYTREHPRLDNPQLDVTVVRGKPENAIEKAVKAVRKEFDEFETAFLDATK